MRPGWPRSQRRTASGCFPAGWSASVRGPAPMTREQTGLLLCLLSAAAFSTSTLFGRVALDDGAGVVTILALRYAGASPLFWGIVGLAGQPLPSLPAAARVLGLGATLVALQAILFYAALARLDAGLVTLLLYTFPTMV